MRLTYRHHTMPTAIFIIHHDACLILHQEFVHQPSSTSFSTGAVFLYLLSSDIWIIFWHNIWYRSLSSS